MTSTDLEQREEDNNEPVVINYPDLAPMHQAVGRGISSYVNIEMGLGFIYATIMSPAPRALSLLTLDAVRNFSQKRDIVAAVYPHVLTTDEQSALEKLLNRVGTLSKDRNLLAHWQTGLWHKNMPVDNLQQIEEMEVRLYPGFYSRNNMDFAPKVTRRISEIEDFTQRCIAVFLELVAFDNQIWRRLHPDAHSREKAAVPIIPADP
jgi:hypothetical protein